MKRTTAISLLFLLLASQFGHHILFSIQDWNIRQEQEKKILSHIPDAFLERIEDSPGLAWEEPGREFMKDGRMYDLVRTRTENGRTIHYAIPDTKESDLIKAFAKAQHMDPGGTQGPQSGKTSLKMQIPVFTIPEQDLNTAFIAEEMDHVQIDIDRTISRPRSVLPCPPWA